MRRKACVYRQIVCEQVERWATPIQMQPLRKVAPVDTNNEAPAKGHEVSVYVLPMADRLDVNAKTRQWFRYMRRILWHGCQIGPDALRSIPTIERRVMSAAELPWQPN
jgi:hypothetical protein